MAESLELNASRSLLWAELWWRSE